MKARAAFNPKKKGVIHFHTFQLPRVRTDPRALGNRWLAQTLVQQCRGSGLSFRPSDTVVSARFPHSVTSFSILDVPVRSFVCMQSCVVTSNLQQGQNNPRTTQAQYMVGTSHAAVEVSLDYSISTNNGCRLRGSSTEKLLNHLYFFLIP